MPSLARSCDGLTIGTVPGDRSAPSEVGLLDRRSASRHIQDPTDRLRVLYRLILNQKLSALHVTKRNRMRVRDCITPPRRGSPIETMIGGDSPHQVTLPLTTFVYKIYLWVIPPPPGTPFF